MKKKKLIIFLVLIIIIISGIYVLETNPDSRGYINKTINKIEGKTLNEKFETKIKSGNLSTDYVIDEVLSDVSKFQLNTLNIPVVINIDNLSSSNMIVDKGSEYKAIQLIKKLKGKKINIILEPYPWIDNGSKYETAWKPDNINTFFWNWKTNVLKVLIDDIAIPYHVDVLNIGSSFVNMEYAEEYWCDTIDYVRKYYKGLVTYRTGWWYTAEWKPETVKKYENKLNNKLFSKLDFISIAAYFELTNNETNTVENLVSSIQSTQIYSRKQNIKQEIKNFHDKWKKPIFFGELGFPKTKQASVHPWNPYETDVMNDVEQANCFEAYRRVFEKESWFLGFSIFAIGEHSSDKHYYPSEESTSVIQNWYKKTNN
ncbi:glycoside hydrolase family 113 [Clostridium sp. DJ247]|uniref:glycoside hydrolase family 113 n=1 Tax=Clostridium sp. DJ247 TaxID=2726188 RepID=UPI001624E5C7|nr:hydrolase [Clostridium sp. DJ247]MBC2580474.1 hydrolase [Clostridium sp. DJ247]